MGPASPEMWYEALGAPGGVVIRTKDLARMRSELEEIRRQLDDPDLNCLEIIVSPVNPREDLWIIKRKPNETKRDLPAAKGDAEPAQG